LCSQDESNNPPPRGAPPPKAFQVTYNDNLVPGQVRRKHS
jgi:hypothetical protein